jgi:hypothetical protein
VTLAGSHLYSCSTLQTPSPPQQPGSSRCSHTLWLLLLLGWKETPTLPSTTVLLLGQQRQRQAQHSTAVAAAALRASPLQMAVGMALATMAPTLTDHPSV